MSYVFELQLKYQYNYARNWLLLKPALMVSRKEELAGCLEPIEI